MRDGFKVLDSDIHVVEPDSVWTEYLEPRYREQGPQPRIGGQHEWLRMRGRALPAYADTPERQRALQLRYARSEFVDGFAERGPDDVHDLTHGTRPATMLAAMDREGIDVAVVFRTFAAHAIAFDDLEPELAGAICRAFNRWLTDFCSAAPERLFAGAQVPLHDMDVAVAEARFAVEQLGALTLVLPSHPVRGRTLDDRFHDPLWAVAQDLDVAVSFHGIQASYTEGMLGNRFRANHVIGHAAGHPIELMLALGAVITGGVCARFPGLRLAFLEGNCGWLPWWLYALDERFKGWGDHETTGQHDLPSEMFRRQCWVSTDVDESELAHVCDVLGDTNIVVSTDWPHDDSAYPHALTEFLALPISDEARRQILWDNCARLYGLDA